MTPEKRALIKAFVENQALFDTVREVFLATVSGTTFERAVLEDAELLVDDALFGQLTRARSKGLGYVNRGFAHLQKIASDREGVQSVKDSSR